MPKKMSFGAVLTMQNDLVLFEEQAKLARDNGFTHMDIAALHDRARYQVADDPTDPWLQWNLSNPSFFKILPPDELKDFVPADVAKRDLDLLLARASILEKLGMHGTFTTWDPTWMPESFFQKRPEWRGPRVDHARRSKHKRFAPCMDHPEVLALYRSTVKELLTLAPCIDSIHISTNDSGCGMCWSSYLYNSPNGPEACKHIGIGERVSTFLYNLKLGAEDAGVDATISLASQLSRTEADAILACLKPGTGLVDWNGTVKVKEAPTERSAGAGASPMYMPLVNTLPTHATLADGLRGFPGAQYVSVGADPRSPYFKDFIEMAGEAVKRDSLTLPERNALLLSFAERRVGTELGPKLYEAMELLGRSLPLLTVPEDGGSIFDIGLLMQRWVTRPFVPFPLELTDEEKSHYRPFLFQAKDEVCAADMLNMQDTYLIDSRVGARQFEYIWQTPMRGIRQAQSIFDELAVKVPGDEGVLCRRVAYALRAMLCLCQCAINCAHFQTWMYDFREPEGGVKEEYIDMGNYDRMCVYNFYRGEIDNMYALLKIMKEYPDIIDMAEREDQEDTFTFSPKLAEQIQKKIDIMFAHWQDFDRIFPRPNY